MSTTWMWYGNIRYVNLLNRKINVNCGVVCRHCFLKLIPFKLILTARELPVKIANTCSAVTVCKVTILENAIRRNQMHRVDLLEAAKEN